MEVANYQFGFNYINNNHQGVHFNELSDELILNIFSHLDYTDLGKCCQVSKGWKQIASDDTLWKHHFPAVKFPENVSGKSYLDTHVIEIDKVEDFFRKFSKKISLFQKGEFTCVSLFYSNRHLFTKFAHGRLSEGDIQVSEIFKELIIVKDQRTREQSPIKNDHDDDISYNFSESVSTQIHGSSSQEYAKLQFSLYTILEEEWVKEINKKEEAFKQQAAQSKNCILL